MSETDYVFPIFLFLLKLIQFFSIILLVGYCVANFFLFPRPSLKTWGMRIACVFVEQMFKVKFSSISVRFTTKALYLLTNRKTPLKMDVIFVQVLMYSRGLRKR